jgi:hypothetical protein
MLAPLLHESPRRPSLRRRSGTRRLVERGSLTYETNNEDNHANPEDAGTGCGESGVAKCQRADDDRDCVTDGGDVGDSLVTAGTRSTSDISWPRVMRLRFQPH